MSIGVYWCLFSVYVVSISIYLVSISVNSSALGGLWEWSGSRIASQGLSGRAPRDGILDPVGTQGEPGRLSRSGERDSHRRDLPWGPSAALEAQGVQLRSASPTAESRTCISGYGDWRSLTVRSGEPFQPLV